jgi:hypothetical protein
MKTLHTKSPCCHASVQRFGIRRRRCAQCHTTWRIRKKKRGRKQHRADHTLALAYLRKEIPSVRLLAQQYDCGKDRIHTLLRRSLAVYVAREEEQWSRVLLDAPHLIAVADAIWYHVGKEFYTIYIMLLRPATSTDAVICPPIVLSGREDLAGWEQAFASLPPVLQKRIIALVCDGATSLIALARSRHWILQRCRFHLIAAVQNYLTTGRRSTHRAYAFRVLRTVQALLATHEPGEIKKIRRAIRGIRHQSKSRGLRRVLSGFLKTYPDYHAYLRYPELNLPTTSNAAESCIQCIRDLMYRCRGFRSYSSLLLWLTAFALFKKTIRCNGKKSTKLNQ